MPIAIAGVTHDITISSGATKYGFMIVPGSFRSERVDDFAPRIATGTDSKTREGYWDSYTQSSSSEGIDQNTLVNLAKINRADGNVFTDLPGAIQLDSVWSTLDGSQVSTAPMIIDFTTSALSLMVVAAGTRVRRSSVSPYTTWTNHSGSAFISNCVWLHSHNGFLFAATGTGSDFYRSSDADTWTQPSVGIKANAFTTWIKSDGTVYVVCATANGFRLSTDNGATWGSVTTVGSSGSNITGLSSAFGYLLIGKEDGLWRFDGVYLVDIVQYPTQLSSTNFRCIVSFDGFVYTNVGGRILKLALSSGAVTSLVDITPEQSGSSDKELYGHGKVVWMFAGPFMLYAALNQGQNVFPELLAYSGTGWHQRFIGRQSLLSSAITVSQTTITISDASIIPSGSSILVNSEQMTVSSVDATGLILTVTRAINSTTAASAASGDTVICLGTMSGAGYSSLGNRLVVNQNSTTIARRQISLRDVPFEDYYSYGVMDTSDYTGDLPFMNKAFRALNVEARGLSVSETGVDDLAGRKIVVTYSIDKGATFKTLGTVTNNGRTNLPFTPTTQNTFSDIATINANSLRLRFKFVRGTVATKSPSLTRYSVDFLNRPLATHAHSLTLRLGTTMTLRDGTMETVSVAERLQFLESSEVAESPLRFISMTGRHYLVYITKTSVVKTEKENEDERNVSVVMVDATTAIWPQTSHGLKISTVVSVQALNMYYYDFDGFESIPAPNAQIIWQGNYNSFTSLIYDTNLYDITLTRTSARYTV